MSKMKKFFKGLGVISVPALCVYAIVGAVVVPLLIFETGASKEYNNTAQKRSEKHWDESFAASKTDKLGDNFNFKKMTGTDGKEVTFKVDGRDSYIYELTGADKKTVINDKSDKLMIFSHGLNSTHWNVMESAFYWAALGYRVISWDQRGGGDNRDSHITFGYAEADDLNNLYKTVIADKVLLGDPKEITMYGQSNGAATTISFADRFQKTIMDGGIDTRFIEESGYTSPKRQFETALNLHGIMPAAVVPLTIPMYELYADKNLSDDNADYLAQSVNIKQPLFIVHGDADPIVDYKMGVELYQTMMADTTRIKEKDAAGTTDEKIKPSIFIGKDLKHIGVSRDSIINVVSGMRADVVQYLSDIQDSSITTPEMVKDKYTKLNTKYANKLPAAIRFFTEVYMWDHFSVQLEDVGGEIVYGK